MNGLAQDSGNSSANAQESWQSWAQSLIYNDTSQQHVNYQYHYSIHHYRHSLFTSDIYVVWNNLQIYSINCQWYYISPQQIITRLKKQIEIICLSSIKLNTFQYKISVLNLPPITPNLSAINSVTQPRVWSLLMYIYSCEHGWTSWSNSRNGMGTMW